MSIARLTSLGALAALASCNLNHPALEPPSYPEHASVTRNGTDYLVAELENPTSEYVATAPPQSVAPPAPATETGPMPPAARPAPTLAQPQPRPVAAAPKPQVAAVAEPQPAPEPQPETELAAKPDPTPAPAPAEPEPVAEPAKPTPAPTVAALEPEPTPEPESDARRAEDFAIEFTKTLPFPSDAEISAFPQVLSLDTLAATSSKLESANSAILLDKVRKNLATTTSAKRAATPWGNQPSTAAKIPAPKPLQESGETLDPSIESLSIIPASPHDERLDFGLDLGPAATYDFGDTPE